MVVDMRSGACYELNRVGVVVWEKLGQGLTIEAVTASIAESYGMAYEVIADDVPALVQSLLDRGLITPPTNEPGAPPPE